MAIPNAEEDLGAGERNLNKIDQDSGQSLKKWGTEKEQKIYTSKLLDTLRRVRSSTPAAHGLRRSRVIREAADRCLAIAARGRTRWSRAILSNRKLYLKRRRPSSSSLKSTFYTAVSRSKKKNSPMLVGKAAFLGRLIPGGRKLSFPMLLVEASDYIAALQMQVRAMSALTTILSASGKTQAEADGSSL